MITLSNGYSFEYMTASGSLEFDINGWPWERPSVKLGLIKPELFLNAIKTLTRHNRPGNLHWWNPWTCVRPIPGGAVNKVGLTNKGVEWWCKKIGPKIDFNRIKVAASIFGTEDELVEMAVMLNQFPFVALKVNPSCPNTGHALQTTKMVVDSVKAVKQVSVHPIILKISAAQDYLAIARELQETIEAISLNSVPWEMVYPKTRSPLWRLEKKVGGGGGGVSGIPAQKFNWKAVRELADQNLVPVIGPSVMSYEDLAKVRALGAKAISFGTIHLPSYPVWLKPWTIFTNPCKPTIFVKKELIE